MSKNTNTTIPIKEYGRMLDTIINLTHQVSQQRALINKQSALINKQVKALDSYKITIKHIKLDDIRDKKELGKTAHMGND